MLILAFVFLFTGVLLGFLITYLTCIWSHR